MLCPKPVQDSMFEMHDEDSWSKCHINACCANCFYHYTIALINKHPVASPIVHSMYMHLYNRNVLRYDAQVMFHL